ncbi:MAG: hypothetical protein JWN77_92 [Frankiales bacterium]|nr:hypothetical protein [Frankiales bacterium]MCW2929020.1 hypothetical protein [Thermoleophilia bacterium]
MQADGASAPTEGKRIMFDRLRNRLDAGRQDGFTLIELLIVIVILGILAAIVVFAVGGITDRGQTSACKADLKTVQVASEAYKAQTGSYATGMAQLKPGFIQEVPTTVSYSGGGATAPVIGAAGTCAPAPAAT